MMDGIAGQKSENNLILNSRPWLDRNLVTLCIPFDDSYHSFEEGKSLILNLCAMHKPECRSVIFIKDEVMRTTK